MERRSARGGRGGRLRQRRHQNTRNAQSSSSSVSASVAASSSQAAGSMSVTNSDIKTTTTTTTTAAATSAASILLDSQDVMKSSEFIASSKVNWSGIFDYVDSKRADALDTASTHHRTLRALVKLPPAKLAERLNEATTSGEIVLERDLPLLVQSVLQRMSLATLDDVTAQLDILMCGCDREAFVSHLGIDDSGGVCGRVFRRGEPAYQCLTCGVDRTCIQCMSCFKLSDHKGHETIMTHAGGGGCCDCGDPESWDPSGFCTRHRGPNAAQADEAAGTSLSPAIQKRCEPVLSALIGVLANLSAQPFAHIYDLGVLPRSSHVAPSAAIGNAEAYMLHSPQAHTIQSEIVMQTVHADSTAAVTSATRAAGPNMALLFLIDDNHHSFDFVIEALTEILKIPPSDAAEVAAIVDNRGFALISAMSASNFPTDRSWSEIVPLSETEEFQHLDEPSRVDYLRADIKDAANIEELPLMCEQYRRLRRRGLQVRVINSVPCHDLVLFDDAQRTHITQYVMKWSSSCFPMRRIISNVLLASNPNCSVGLCDDCTPNSPSTTNANAASRICGPNAADSKSSSSATASAATTAAATAAVMDMLMDENDTSNAVSIDPSLQRSKFALIATFDESRSPDNLRSPDIRRLDQWLPWANTAGSETWAMLNAFFLQLFSLPDFKEKFTICFSRHYRSMVFTALHQGRNAYEAILSMSVQIFTIPTMTPRIVKHHQLLENVMRSIKMVFHAATEVAIDYGNTDVSLAADDTVCNDDRKTPQLVPDLEERVINLSKLRYILVHYDHLVRDLEYCLRNDAVVRWIVLEQPRYLAEFLHFLVTFENMNRERVHLRTHQEFESDVWKIAFTLEVRFKHIVELILGGIGACLHDESISESSRTTAASNLLLISLEYAAHASLRAARQHSWASSSSENKVKIILYNQVACAYLTCIRAKHHWTGSDSATSKTMFPVILLPADVKPVSFHFPAQRMAARIIGRVLTSPVAEHHGDQLGSLLQEFETESSQIMLDNDRAIHISIPYWVFMLACSGRLVAASAHMRAGFWVRNGNPALNQIFNYERHLLYSTMRGSDILVLQLALSHLQPEWFVQIMLHYFMLDDAFVPTERERLSLETNVNVDNHAVESSTGIASASSSSAAAAAAAVSNRPSTASTTAEAVSATVSATAAGTLHPTLPMVTSAFLQGIISKNNRRRFRSTSSSPVDTEQLVENWLKTRFDIQALRLDLSCEARFGDKLARVIELWFEMMVTVLSDRSFVSSTSATGGKIRKHVIHRLMRSKPTFSNVANGLELEFPTTTDLNVCIEQVLKEVAVFVQPSGLESGYYQIKPQALSEFDPYYTHFTLEQRERAERDFADRLSTAAVQAARQSSGVQFPTWHMPPVEHVVPTPSFEQAHAHEHVVYPPVRTYPRLSASFKPMLQLLCSPSMTSMWHIVLYRVVAALEEKEVPSTPVTPNSKSQPSSSSSSVASDSPTSDSSSTQSTGAALSIRAAFAQLQDILRPRSSPNTDSKRNKDSDPKAHRTTACITDRCVTHVLKLMSMAVCEYEQPSSPEQRQFCDAVVAQFLHSGTLHLLCRLLQPSSHSVDGVVNVSRAATRRYSSHMALVRYIVNRICMLDSTGACKDVVRQLVPAQAQTTGSSEAADSKMTERERRRAAAKARQAAMMAKMKAKQNAFAKANASDLTEEKKRGDAAQKAMMLRRQQSLESDSNDASSSSMSATAATASTEELATFGVMLHECVVCHTHRDDSPLGFVGFVQNSCSSMLAQCAPVEPMHLRFTDDNIQRRRGGIVQFCGHAMHFACRDQYFASLVQKRLDGTLFLGQNSVNLEANELICPACNQITNVLLPEPEAVEHMGVVRSVSDEAIEALGCQTGQVSVAELIKAVQAGLQDPNSLWNNECPTLAQVQFSHLRDFVMKLESMDTTRRSKSSVWNTSQRFKHIKSAGLFVDVFVHSIESFEVSARLEPRGAFGSLRERDVNYLKCLFGSIQEFVHSSQNSEIRNKIREHSWHRLIASVLPQSLSADTGSDDDLKAPGTIPSDCDLFALVVELTVAYPPHAHLHERIEPLFGLVLLMRVVQTTRHLHRQQNVAAAAAHVDTEMTDAADTLASGGPIPLRFVQECMRENGVLEADTLPQHVSMKDVVPYVLPLARQLALLRATIFPLTTASYQNAVTACKIDHSSASAHDSDSKMMFNSSEWTMELSPEQQLAELEQLCSYLQAPSLANLCADTQLTGLAQQWMKSTDFTSALVPSCETANIIPYRAPALSIVPAEYDSLFQALEVDRSTDSDDASDTAMKECRQCHKTPASPAICLMCSELLCAASSCCARNAVHELSFHTQLCGGGGGAFLLLNESAVILIQNGLAVNYGSAYVDSHGELDIGLQRGRSLYLNERRWRTLLGVIVKHRIPFSVSSIRNKLYAQQCIRRNYF
jgi:ATP-dependent Clp protease adapter protein ClpS